MTSTPSSRTPSESVQCTKTESGFRLDMSGEIDLIARPRLNDVLAEITAAPPTDIVVDLSDVSFLGSEALSFFAALHGHAGPDHRVVLHRPNRSARRSLELTGFDQVLVITDEQPVTARTADSAVGH